MVTEKHYFVTDDGQQFEFRWQAELHELHADIRECLDEGIVDHEFDSAVALAALLKKYDLTKKVAV